MEIKDIIPTFLYLLQSILFFTIYLEVGEICVYMYSTSYRLEGGDKVAYCDRIHLVNVSR
jgi:hypothetical protein